MSFPRHLSRSVLLDAARQISLLTAQAQLPRHAESTDEDGVFRRPPPAQGNYFSDRQRQILDAVYQRLFPEDGNGPGARDLNALPYLEWALTDPVNVADGDLPFIADGVGQLDDLSRRAYGAAFVDLSGDVQERVLERTAASTSGKRLLSLLLFYLTEALMLDPYYGGNPDMIGWLWLEHRPGFPRPIDGRTYRHFD